MNPYILPVVLLFLGCFIIFFLVQDVESKPTIPPILATNSPSLGTPSQSFRQTSNPSNTRGATSRHRPPRYFPWNIFYSSNVYVTDQNSSPTERQRAQRISTTQPVMNTTMPAMTMGMTPGMTPGMTMGMPSMITSSPSLINATDSPMFATASPSYTTSPMFATASPSYTTSPMFATESPSYTTSPMFATASPSYTTSPMFATDSPYASLAP